MSDATPMRLKGESNVYITPPRIADRVRLHFGGVIPCDAATEPNNPLGAATYFTEETNGLAQPWPNKVFVNPPYSGGAMKDWCRKIDEEARRGCEIVALLPCGARFSTRYWQDYILTGVLDHICFVRGRVAFARPDGSIAKQNPYDSQILGFNTFDPAMRFLDSFGPLGKVLELARVN